MNIKPKIIIVCGPTATGKSDYAVQLAKEINGEIISADSRQVYKGLDIGSGKITKREMKNVPHYMLDIASPKRTYTVSQYKKQGEKIIKTILAKNKTPIICGGSGFYINTLLGLELPEVPPNKKLRNELSKQTNQELYKSLYQKDRSRALSIDKENKVRLIRALEIIEILGKVPKIKQKNAYRVEWKYLDFEDSILKERIHIRLLKRIKQGMVREVKKLYQSGVSYKKIESFGLEYKYIALFLQKKLTEQEMFLQLENAIWQYVKRQRTWFKKYAK